MQDYKNDSPIFSDKIPITESTDAAHADNINAAPKQLLQNTTVLKDNDEIMNEMFSGQIAEAMKSVQIVDGEVSSLQDSVLQMAMALSTISDADVIDSDNILIETFRDDNDIMITSGIYDSEKCCLYA
jgi:prophage DNA circulation protein